MTGAARVKDLTQTEQNNNRQTFGGKEPPC